MVSFPLTASTVWRNFGPSAATSFFETTGTEFWKPKMFFVSFSTVYFVPSSCGSVAALSNGICTMTCLRRR